MTSVSPEQEAENSPMRPIIVHGKLFIPINGFLTLFVSRMKNNAGRCPKS